MMVRHIVMWKLDDSFSQTEKEEIKNTFKQRLENIANIMDGVLKIEVVINPLDSSNMDMMLVSEFISNDVLKAYQIHPKHVEVSSYLKGKTISRNCMDYVEER